MFPNSRQLALRNDAALVSLLGVVGSGGANFGSERPARRAQARHASFAGEFAGDFGLDIHGDVNPGDEWSAEFEAEFTADPAPVVARPTPQAAMAAWHKQRAAVAHTNRRAMILNPNKGSAAKVERYTFSISQAITMGTGVAINITGQPDTELRPQVVTMNAPSYWFVFIQEMKVANVSVTVGPGVEDAFNYGALAVGKTIDAPTLTPANRASVLGTYTGYVPPGFVNATAGFFTVSFKGPASVVA